MSLKGKVAVVTGSTKGIGAGIAIALAREGCTVVVSSRTGCEGATGRGDTDCGKVVKEIGKMKAKCMAMDCDVSKKKDVDALIAKTLERFGRLDILVNNAGVYPFVSFEKMSEADWDNVMDINLKGVFLCSQAAAKRMKPGGKIINISSIASMVGFPGLVHYCASKGGVNAMTRALALELASKKINVNTVAPGAITTPGASKSSTEESTKQTISVIPWKRMGLPEDIANAVVFLASDKSDYMTGQIITVDGGWTIQ